MVPEMTLPTLPEMTVRQQQANARWLEAHALYVCTLRSFNHPDPSWPNRLAVVTEEMTRSLQAFEDSQVQADYALASRCTNPLRGSN